MIKNATAMGRHFISAGGRRDSRLRHWHQLVCTIRRVDHEKKTRKFGLKNRKIKVRKILVPQKISATKISWNKVFTVYNQGAPRWLSWLFLTLATCSHFMPWWNCGWHGFWSSNFVHVLKMSKWCHGKIRVVMDSLSREFSLRAHFLTVPW